MRQNNLVVFIITCCASVQVLLRDPAFVGHEGALIRALGLTVVVIGWLYLWGGRSGARQIVVSTVIDRIVFVPAVLLPLALAGVFLISSSHSRFSTFC